MDNTSKRPSFLIYKSFYKPIKNLSNEDKGKLFTAIFEYQTKDFDGSKQVIEPQIQMAFEFFKNQFELDNKKYEKTVKSRSANGKKGGRPKNSVKDNVQNKKANENKKTHGFLGNPIKPKKGEKEKEKEKEKDKEKENYSTVTLPLKEDTPLANAIKDLTKGSSDFGFVEFTDRDLLPENPNHSLFKNQTTPVDVKRVRDETIYFIHTHIICGFNISYER